MPKTFQALKFPSINLVEEEGKRLTSSKKRATKNFQLTTLGLKNIRADLLKQGTMKTIQHHLQKDLGLPKNLLTGHLGNGAG